MGPAHSPAGQHQTSDRLGPGPAHQRAGSKLSTSLTHQRANIGPGTDQAQALPPAWQHKLQDTLDPTASCVRMQSHPPAVTSSGTLGPCSQSLGPSPVHPWASTALGPELTHWWVGISLGISCTPTLPTSEPALTPGSPRVLQPAQHLTLPYAWAPPRSDCQPLHKGGPGNQQTRSQLSLLDYPTTDYW